MNKTKLLTIIFTFLLLASVPFLYKTKAAFAVCNCPGGDCDHCGCGNVSWGKSGGCGGFCAQNPGACAQNCGECGVDGGGDGGGGGCIPNDFNNWGADCPTPPPPPPPCNPNAWGGWAPVCTAQNCQTAIRERTNECGNKETNPCSCTIVYPTPTPTPPGFTPTPTPSSLTPTPAPPVNGYFPGWFKTENGDVHSNKDIIVSLPTILERFATYLITTANLSSFAAGSASDARPELASAKNWYWYTPPYGAINFAENAGFYAYYTHNKPPNNTLVTDGINNSLINSLIQDNKAVRIQINPTGNAAIVSENITLSANKLLILYINGDLNINANITLPDNSGIVFVVKGNLNIAGQVTQSDGFYLVDGVVNTTDNSGSGSPLVIHGGVFVSQNGRIFGTSRQIHDANIPSEKIIYEPKYLINFAKGLGHIGITWREIAP